MNQAIRLIHKHLSFPLKSCLHCTVINIMKNFTQAHFKANTTVNQRSCVCWFIFEVYILHVHVNIKSLRYPKKYALNITWAKEIQSTLTWDSEMCLRKCVTRSHLIYFIGGNTKAHTTIKLLFIAKRYVLELNFYHERYILFNRHAGFCEAFPMTNTANCSGLSLTHSLLAMGYLVQNSFAYITKKSAVNELSQFLPSDPFYRVVDQLTPRKHTHTSILWSPHIS